MATAKAPISGHETASMLHQATTSKSNFCPTHSPSIFLSLPLEVRLQIYGYILESTPAKHAHLSPSSTYPLAAASASFLKATTVPVAFQASKGKSGAKDDPEPPSSTSTPSLRSILAPVRRDTGCGCVPTALLRACKQVYEEARMLPWERNEYAFVNWFSSGVYAARSFLRALRPWQRDGMRWAHIEVLRRDLEDTRFATLAGGRLGTGEWKDLCHLWAGDTGTGDGGLWGLRLGIKGRVGAYVVGEAIDGSGGVSVAMPESATEGDDIGPAQSRQKGLLDVNAQWISQGLAQMTALRHLEVEIEDDHVSQHVKVVFCQALGRKLSDNPGRRVQVFFGGEVERRCEREEARRD